MRHAVADGLHAAVPVHGGLGQPGRARRVQPQHDVVVGRRGRRRETPACRRRRTRTASLPAGPRRPSGTIAAVPSDRRPARPATEEPSQTSARASLSVRMKCRSAAVSIGATGTGTSPALMAPQNEMTNSGRSRVVRMTRSPRSSPSRADPHRPHRRPRSPRHSSSPLRRPAGTGRLHGGRCVRGDRRRRCRGGSRSPTREACRSSRCSFPDWRCGGRGPAGTATPIAGAPR